MKDVKQFKILNISKKKTPYGEIFIVEATKDY